MFLKKKNKERFKIKKTFLTCKNILNKLHQKINNYNYKKTKLFI